MLKCVALICFTLAILVIGQEDWRLVNIAQGPVRGRLDPEGGLHVFYNIPYATAPTGADRFKVNMLNHILPIITIFQILFGNFKILF